MAVANTATRTAVSNPILDLIMHLAAQTLI
jgi:hypothetical protein